MSKRLTRQQLYALVWERPITKLAKEFGLSDVALHKICRKFRVPTPPPGYWAKKAHGKPVSTSPLPDAENTREILIRETTASNEPEPIAEARLAMAAALDAGVTVAPPNPIVERTLAKLANARRGADGLVRCAGERVVSMSVRPASFERVGALLGAFVAAGEGAGLKLANHNGACAWLCDDEFIGFELVEVPDRVEHVATQRELDAVAKWKREREQTHKRHGYWQDWGEPKIPQWEQRFQGRLAIRLDEVRIQSERSPWGETMMRTFADTRTRDVNKMIPRAVTTIAAMAAAKKSNRQVEARRRAAQEQAARRWQEAERRRVEDQHAGRLLEQLLAEKRSAEQLRAFILELRTGESGGARLDAFITWAERRLKNFEAQLTPATLEQRVAQAGLFDTEG